jgi:hypothetical protein
MSEKLNIKDRLGLLRFFLKILFTHIKINRKAEKLGYYTSIDDIPIYNWDKIENGKFEYLFKDKKGEVPEYFKQVISDMFFQFDKINMTLIEKKHKLAYLRSLVLTSSNRNQQVRYLNMSNHLDAEIKELESKSIKKSTLNEKINYIETVFYSINSIDPKKTSASRFYSLFNLAIDRATKINSNGSNR